MNPPPPRQQLRPGASSVGTPSLYAQHPNISPQSAIQKRPRDDSNQKYVEARLQIYAKVTLDFFPFILFFIFPFANNK